MGDTDADAEPDPGRDADSLVDPLVCIGSKLSIEPHPIEPIIEKKSSHPTHIVRWGASAIE